MDRGDWGYSPWGHKRVRHNLVTKQQVFSLSLHTDYSNKNKDYYYFIFFMFLNIPIMDYFAYYLK